MQNEVFNEMVDNWKVRQRNVGEHLKSCEAIKQTMSVAQKEYKIGFWKYLKEKFLRRSAVKDVPKVIALFEYRVRASETLTSMCEELKRRLLSEQFGKTSFYHLYRSVSCTLFS